MFAKYASASQWEGAEMRTGRAARTYQFLIAGVPESLEYYVEAGGVRSPNYKLNVVDLPGVKKIARDLSTIPACLGLRTPRKIRAAICARSKARLPRSP